ncbi:MAG: hypothetical protein RRY79_00245 [Clostridia bacterium]
MDFGTTASSVVGDADTGSGGITQEPGIRPGGSSAQNPSTFNPAFGASGVSASGINVSETRYLDEYGRDAEASKLYALFDEFYKAYALEWERLSKCDRLYRCAHWEDIPVRDRLEPRPTTPVIHSTIENIRADLFDRFPKAEIKADEPGYEEISKVLTHVISENHIVCDYEREYDKLLYDFLVGGYMVQEVGYDFEANMGLGGAYIRHVDSHCIMFDPYSSSIDDARAVFKFTPFCREYFAEHYPKESERMNPDAYTLRRVKDCALNVDDSDSILLIESWRREFDAEAGIHRIHMQKIAGGVLLEDSRDYKPNGFYSHGKYPFIITPLFRRKGTMLGLGYADLFENQQRFSDKLDQIVMKNALMASHNKLLMTGASGFDLADLKDWSKEVHIGENLNGIRWFSTAPLPSYIIDYISSIRESIKQESGSNDFSRGGTLGGVTAASAIIALQEMSSKRSRMLSRTIHAGFSQAVRLEIEVERENAVFPRTISIDQTAVHYSRDLLRIESSMSVPIEFRVTVSVDHDDSASILAHNETIFKMLQMGIMTPEEAKEKVRISDKREL